jgi:hypothetical protein
MTRDELINKAYEVIGKGQPDDYILDPKGHAKWLAGNAPVLAAILERPQLTVSIEQYEQNDADAKAAQALFKATAQRADLAVFVAVCLSAALLVAQTLAPPNIAKPLMIGMSGCAVICGALASMWLFKVREGAMLENWMTARAAAEARRLSYFGSVTSAQSTSDSAIPLPLLQVEYFRRYQLELQRAFFRKRSRDFQQAASRILGLSAFAVLLGSLASGLGGGLGGVLGGPWVSIAALGTVAAGLSSFAASREGLGQNRRNAERYKKTLAALDDLTSKLDDVRNAAATGAHEPVQAFVAAIHEQLLLEHQQWLGTAENVKTSLGVLEEALKNAQPKSAKAADAK